MLILCFILLFSCNIFCTEKIERSTAKEAPQERSSIIEEKIENAKKKAYEEEKRIQKAEAEIKEYRNNIKIASTQETIQSYQEKISIAEKTKQEAYKEKKTQEESIKKFEQDKAKLAEMQKELEREATSTKASEEMLANAFQKCIKQRVYELFHIPPEKAPKSTEELVEAFSTSLKQLITYEQIYYRSSSSTTPEDWETLRTKSLQAQPGESMYNAPYKALLKKALEIQSTLEKITGKKVESKSRTAGSNCSLPFFASKFATQKAIEQLNEISNYDN